MIVDILDAGQNSKNKICSRGNMRRFMMLLLIGSTVVRAATFSYDILIPAVPGAPGFLATNAVEIKFASSTVLTSTVLNLQTNPAGISGFTLTGSPVPGATLNFANFNAGPGDAFQIAFLAGPLTLTAGIFAPPASISTIPEFTMSEVPSPINC
jgi:hypothetical protein